MPRTMPRNPWLRYTVRFLATALFLAVCTGCATLEQIVQKPSAVFKNVQLTEASLLQGTALFHFDVTNPNPIGIHASRINYDLNLNGRDFLNGKLDRGLSMAAGSTSRMTIPVTMRYLDFFDSVSRLWQNKFADYVFNGDFTVAGFRIPFQAKGRLRLPQMPKIDLESIQVRNISFSGASLNCRVRMDNPNAFNLLFKRLNYNLKLGGTQFAKASALPTAPLTQNSQSVINLGFDVSFAQLGRSAFSLLQGTRADYSLDGGMVFDAPEGGERQVPFNLSGMVPFIR